MISTKHTQSLTDFRQKASETLERINKTGQAEILTVNGEARAVILAPAVYDQMAREALLARDVIVMRQAVAEIEQGKGREVTAVFDDLRSRLLRVNSATKRGKKTGKWKATVSSSRRSSRS